MARKKKNKSRREEKPCVLRFCNNRPGVTTRVLWVDFDGGEKEYARLDELAFYNQDTYVGHRWRMRDAASGALLAEYAGDAATITLPADGDAQVEPGLHRPPQGEVTDPRWGTYRRRGEALGMPICAFDCVCQEAVDTAAHIMLSVLADADGSIVQAMVDAGAEVAIIGKDQVTTDLPMYRHLRGVDCENGGGDFDDSTRGLGGNSGNPVTSCGEENLLMLAGDRYSYENILVHEFGASRVATTGRAGVALCCAACANAAGRRGPSPARPQHAVMDLGLHDNPLREAILEAYEAARDGGRYDLTCYMMENESEYWAEGTQAWFEATVREDVTSGVNTRQKLQERDPQLAELMTLVYGNGDWRYPQTAPRAFARYDDGAKRRKTAGGGGGDAAQNPLEQVVVAPGSEADMANPLLVGGGNGSGGGVATRRTRRRAGSPARRGSKSSGGGARGLASMPRRITRALARLAGCCLGPGVL